jgi:hypothetical protein
MPEYGQYYDDEIQGHSLSQGHCKYLLALILVSDFYYSAASVLVVQVVKKCGGCFPCVWFD